jgi:hypothetical protein
MFPMMSYQTKANHGDALIRKLAGLLSLSLVAQRATARW